MKHKRILIGTAIALAVASGTLLYQWNRPKEKIEKHVNHSNNVLDVKEMVEEIVIDTPLIGGLAKPYVLNKYFILADSQAENNCFFFFDKKNFAFLTEAGHLGEGPDEITSLGELMIDTAHHRLYAADYGKMQMLGYDLDALLQNPDSKPEYRFDMNKETIPVIFSYAADSLCYVCCMMADPGRHFQESLATWNMTTGAVSSLISGHPEVERKRFRYAVSLENDLIAVSYDHHDLLAIYDLKGNLKHYVYGPNWDNATSNAMIYYYGGIAVCKNRIIIGYSGKKNPEMGQIHVTSFIVYDLEGNYIKTLNVGHDIILFCYDPEYHRIIMTLDDEMQFAFLNLDGLLDE